MDRVASRGVLGLVAGALAIVATIGAGQSVIAIIALAHGSPSLIFPGLLGPAMLLASAAVLSRIAYRNLFWRRYIASIQRKQSRPVA
jgi:hypothetical protein